MDEWGYFCDLNRVLFKRFQSQGFQTADLPPVGQLVIGFFSHGPDYTPI
jgi:hypothetical protein